MFTTPRQHTPRIRALLILACTAITALAAAVFPDHPNAGYRPVGMIGSTATGIFVQTGSGVAISPDWVISAAHVGGNMFIQNGHEYPILQKIPNTNPGGEAADLALFKLGQPTMDYANVLLLPFDIPGSSADLKGRTVYLVGYGRTASVRPDGLGWSPTPGTEGVKRVATNRLDLVQVMRANFGTDTNPKWKSTTCLIYDLDKPGDASLSTLGTSITANEGGVASKDSGGGWFVNYNNELFLVAYSVSTAVPDNSTLPNPYYFGGWGCGAHLYAYKDWIFSVTKLPQFASTVSSFNAPSSFKGSPAIYAASGFCGAVGLVLLTRKARR